MDETRWTLALLGLAAIWWIVAKPYAVFVVRMRRGQAVSARGKVTAAFLAAVTEVFAESGVTSGEVRGVRRGRRISLWFSSRVPPGARQRLRNWWAIGGWTLKHSRK